MLWSFNVTEYHGLWQHPCYGHRTSHMLFVVLHFLPWSTCHSFPLFNLYVWICATATIITYFPFYSATNNQTSTTIHYWNWIRVSWFRRVCWIWSLCWCLEMLHILPTDIPWYLPLVYSSWQYIFGFYLKYIIVLIMTITYDMS